MSLKVKFSILYDKVSCKDYIALPDFPNSTFLKVNDLVVSFKESKHTVLNFSMLNIKENIEK